MASPLEAVQVLHQSLWQGSIAVTGGGSQLISQLCAVPGASRTLLEAIVPYGRTALQNYLQSAADHPCTPVTARALAARAFQRSQAFKKNTAKEDKSDLFGLGCTASLASEPSKRGAHRIHIALQTASLTSCQTILLEKGSRSRSEEEHLAADLCLALLAEHLKLPKIEVALLPAEQIENTTVLGLPAWRDLFTGEKQAVDTGGHQPSPDSKRRLIFSSAFNPLHSGHLAMMHHAQRLLGQKVELELCINNPDKVLLDYQTIEERVRLLPKEHTLWLTALPTFLEKCRQFPKTTFLVGIDTAMRIADSTYYEAEASNLEVVVEEMKALECDFLVYGRQSNGTFATVENSPLAPAFRSLCQQVPEVDFRQDLSSTLIRKQLSAS